MRKIFSFVTALVASVSLAYAEPFAEVVVPATTLDFYNPAMVEEAAWYSSEKAYWLDQNVLVTSGLESYRSVGTQTWMTQQSAGSSTSTWDALPPFRGSNFYAKASYATLQEDRYIAYRVTNCDSVWAYGYNNAASKYLYMDAYELSNPETASLNPATDTKISTDNSAAGGKGTGVMKLNLDASKTYVIVVSGTGNSNSRLFEIAFFRKPGGITKTYYTVAGGLTTEGGIDDPVFGKSWDPTNTANDMVLNPSTNLYEWSKSEVKLAAGKIEFKVVKDHAWTEAWPESNWVLNIPEPGFYTVEIDFNEETKAINAKATKTGDVPVIPKMDVKGAWDGWTIHDLAIAEDEKSASVELEIAAPGVFEFGLDENDIFIANAATVSRINSRVEGLEGNTGNMKLDADQAGTYRFVWTYASRTLVVTFPKKEANLDDYNLAYTWNGKRGETPATEAVQQGGTAEAYGGNSNIVVGATQQNNVVIKLGKGWNNGEFYVGIALDEPLAEGDLLEIAAFRTSDSKAVFGIDFCANAEDGANAVGQILLPDELQKPSSAVAPEDEYWPVPKEAAGKKFIRLYRYSGSTTVWVANFTVYRLKGAQGFEHIAAEGKTVKVIHNGQLLILRGDKTFNAQGAIVQ